jgi:acid phosphatase
MKKLFNGILLLSSSVLLFSCHRRAETSRQTGSLRPQHIIIVIEENHNYEQIIGSSNAPFINQLAKEAAVFTDAHGVAHPSQPNYLALFSGSLQGVNGDKCLEDSKPFTTPNLAASMISNGFSFTGFAENMPAPVSWVANRTAAC